MLTRALLWPTFFIASGIMFEVISRPAAMILADIFG